MKRADMEPIVIEDLVKFGEDRGYDRGLALAFDTARQGLMGVLAARGLVVSDAHRQRIDSELDLDRLRLWLQASVTAASVEEALR